MRGEVCVGEGAVHSLTTSPRTVLKVGGRDEPFSAPHQQLVKPPFLYNPPPFQPPSVSS